MLYHLLYPLHKHAYLSFLNVVRYVSTRTILAVLTALLLSLLLGPWFIERLKARLQKDGGSGPDLNALLKQLLPAVAARLSEQPGTGPWWRRWWAGWRGGALVAAAAR